MSAWVHTKNAYLNSMSSKVSFLLAWKVKTFGRLQHQLFAWHSYKYVFVLVSYWGWDNLWRRDCFRTADSLSAVSAEVRSSLSLSHLPEKISIKRDRTWKRELASGGVGGNGISGWHTSHPSPVPAYILLADLASDSIAPPTFLCLSRYCNHKRTYIFF